jgi:hypothetical protein
LDEDRSAALVVRVWLENGTSRLRARLTTADTTPGREVGEEVTVTVASSPRDVVIAVRAWLDEFLNSEGDSLASGE